MVLNNEKDVLVKKKFILQFAKEDDIRTTEIFSQRWNICFYYQSYQRVNFLKHCMFIGICWYKIRRKFSLSANSKMKYGQDFKILKRCRLRMLKIPRTEIYSLFSIYQYIYLHCTKQSIVLKTHQTWAYKFITTLSERERESAAQKFDALTLIMLITYILSENLSGEEK